MRVDLPALGKPTMAASAISLSFEHERQLLAVLSLLGETRGPMPAADERSVAPFPRDLLLPPRSVGAGSTRSARTVPSLDLTIVPSGTEITRSSPLRPWRMSPSPWVPSPARRWG